MTLFEKDEVDGLGFPDSIFYRKWKPGEPEAVACDYADVTSPGPFLLLANDEAAWMSHGDGSWLKIAVNTRYDGPEQKRWSVLATLYAETDRLTLRNLTYRIAAIRRKAKRVGGWLVWDEVYHWDRGSDLVWNGLINHPWLETRTKDGVREVKYGRQ